MKTRQQTTFANKTLVDTFSLTLQKEGVFAFWKGALPALSSALIENAVVFTANGALKRMVLERDGGGQDRSLSFAEEAVVGGVSGIFSATAICPAEVIKVRMQANLNLNAGALGHQQGNRPSFLSAIRQVFLENGALGYFRGLGAIISRDVPFYMSFFGAYEGYFRVCFGASSSSLADVNPVHFVLGGGLAGMVAWSVVFPFDVVKSRQQLSSGKDTKSFRAILLDLKREGFRKSMKGWTPAVLRGFPANGALFLGVELSRKMMGD
jgi:hypothetical protein